MHPIFRKIPVRVALVYSHKFPGFWVAYFQPPLDAFAALLNEMPFEECTDLDEKLGKAAWQNLVKL